MDEGTGLRRWHYKLLVALFRFRVRPKEATYVLLLGLRFNMQISSQHWIYLVVQPGAELAELSISTLLKCMGDQ